MLKLFSSLLSYPQIVARFLPLALLMLATRFHHIGSAYHLPDASWAVFFLGGFYLTRRWFALFLIEAVAIDFAFFAAGGSSYCLSSAYGFLLPAYGALWFGGELLAKNTQCGVRFALSAIAYWWIAASIAYLLTNGSFYFLSGRVAQPSAVDYWQHASIWYRDFVTGPIVYLIVAAMVRIVAKEISRWRVAAQ